MEDVRSKQQLKDAARNAVWSRFKSPNGKSMVNTDTRQFASRRERRAAVKYVLRRGKNGQVTE